MILKLIEDKSTESIVSFIGIRVIIILSCWATMVISTLIDLWSGTSTAKALGEPLSSKGFRRTIAKDADYMRIMLFALMFDVMGICFIHVYILPFVTILCTVAILIIEGKSVIENSRRKKAHAADIPETVKQIIHAVTAEQATALLNTITKLTHENKSGKEVAES